MSILIELVQVRELQNFKRQADDMGVVYSFNTFFRPSLHGSILSGSKDHALVVPSLVFPSQYYYAMTEKGSTIWSQRQREPKGPHSGAARFEFG